jgi:hypothetical protein
VLSEPGPDLDGGCLGHGCAQGVPGVSHPLQGGVIVKDGEEACQVVHQPTGREGLAGLPPSPGSCPAARSLERTRRRSPVVPWLLEIRPPRVEAKVVGLRTLADAAQPRLRDASSVADRRVLEFGDHLREGGPGLSFGALERSGHLDRSAINCGR